MGSCYVSSSGLKRTFILHPPYESGVIGVHLWLGKHDWKRETDTISAHQKAKPKRSHKGQWQHDHKSSPFLQVDGSVTPSNDTVNNLKEPSEIF